MADYLRKLDVKVPFIVLRNGAKSECPFGQLQGVVII